MRRNIIVFFISMVATVTLAIPCGYLLDKYILNTNGSFATFSIPDDLSAFINGLPVVYLFLIPSLFLIFGGNKKKILIILLGLPILTFSYFISIQYFLCALTSFIIGVILGTIVCKLRI